MADALTDADRARAIVGGGRLGTLCTLAREPAGYPFGSLVAYALDDDANPLFLISRLAEHTSNALEDPRVSLFVAEPPAAAADPLAFGRVTLLGRLVELTDASARDAARGRYLSAHPAAGGYVDFPDFSFFRLDIESVRYVGGFGRMSWVETDEFRGAVPNASE